MAVLCLLMGESGTGKSTSLRNFGKNEISFINVAAKPLPFPGKFTKTIVTDDFDTIKNLVAQATSRTIVIDDAGYVMGFSEMKRRDEKGFQKFTDIGGGFFDILQAAKNLPEEKIVYFIMHTEQTSDGITKAKTSGQMLDRKISLEGLFSIVLRTEVIDGKYCFRTHNSGSDTVKTPLGLFSQDRIDNDLKAVDMAIRKYYGIETTEDKKAKEK